MRPDIFRIKVFDRVEASVVVHLGLAPAVLVNDNHPRHAEVGGHLLVVGSESRSDVDDSGTVLRGHIVTGDHLERLSLIGRLEPRDQLLVADAYEIRAFERAVKHLERHKLVARLVVLKRDVGGLRIEPHVQQVLGQHVDGLVTRVRVE